MINKEIDFHCALCRVYTFRIFTESVQQQQQQEQEQQLWEELQEQQQA